MLLEQRYSHYASKASITEAVVHDIAVEALCGAIGKIHQGGPPSNRPDCPDCFLLLELVQLKDE